MLRLRDPTVRVVYVTSLPIDQAIIDYYLKTAPRGNVTLAILDAQGHVVRSYSSEHPPKPTKPGTVPFTASWLKKPEALSNAAGMHRFTWDLRYASVAPAGRHYFFRGGGGPLAVPGQ